MCQSNCYDFPTFIQNWIVQGSRAQFKPLSLHQSSTFNLAPHQRTSFAFGLKLELENVLNLDVFENFKLNPSLEFWDETARFRSLRTTRPIEIDLKELLVQLIALGIPWTL